VLFALARALGEAVAGRRIEGTLVARAFGSKRADESHRRGCESKPDGFSVLFDAGRREATKRGFALARARTRGRRAGAARRRRAWAVLAFLPTVNRGRARPLRSRWNEPAHRAAGARLACGRRQGAGVVARELVAG